MMVEIKNRRPHISTVTDILTHNTDRLVEILIAELKLERGKLLDQLHAKTLEQIFIENRIYKEIEEVSEASKIHQAIENGLEPHKSKIRREVSKEDIDGLLQIPIRRISLYDINKAKREMREIRARLKEIKSNLNHIVSFTIDFLEYLIDEHKEKFPRRTQIGAFDQIDAREAAQRNLKLRYDKKSGYLGYEINGTLQFDVSTYDRILVIRKTGVYTWINVPDRLFVDKDMLFCGFIDPKRVYTVIYREAKTNYAYIKRCRLDKFILEKGYKLIPPGSKVLKLTTESDIKIRAHYKPKPRVRILEEEFQIADFPIKGKSARGIRPAPREIKSISFI